MKKLYIVLALLLLNLGSMSAREHFSCFTKSSKAVSVDADCSGLAFPAATKSASRQYGPTVIMGETSISILAPVAGRTYRLMQIFPQGEMPVKVQNSNGTDIDFLNLCGVYRVLEDNGTTTEQIGRKMNINSWEFFFHVPHFRCLMDTLKMGPDSLVKTITVFKEIEFSILQLETALRYVNTNSSMHYTCEFVTRPGAAHYTFRLRAKMSSTKDVESVIPIFFTPSSVRLYMKICRGGALQPFNVSGTWNNAEHLSFRVSLDGSQVGVSYSLLLDRHFPSTPLIGSTVATLMGTGEPITFSGIHEKGIYKIVANAIDVSSEMPGSANMYDEADLVLTESNYIKTRQYRNTSGSQYNEGAVHYDGLGRAVQSVDVSAGGNGEDIIQIVEYDNMGRSDAKSYLPYARPNFGFKMSANGKQELENFYEDKFAGDPDRQYPYGQTEYSPAGLVASKKGPGANGNSHPAKFNYRLNTAADAVKKLSIDASGNLVVGGNYPADVLTVTESWQELGSETSAVSIECKNAQGQVVAKRAKVSATDIRTTYYVYDELGRQRYIIPPIQELSATNYTPEQLRKYCYYTEYDKYGNVTKQYVPGAEPVYNIYDKRNRLVMSQSGNQRANGKNEWSYTKYDIYDRPVITGICSGGSYETHKAALESATAFGESAGSSLHGYTNVCYPTGVSSNDVLSVTYYDDYAWQTDNNFAFRSAEALGGAKSDAVTGLATGTKTKVLDSNTSSPQWLTSVIYYDNKYQSIQTISGLYPSGIEVVSNAHNFTGQVTQTRVSQTIGSQTYAYDKWFNFDTRGRLLNVEQQITGDTDNGKVRIAEYAYDELGAVTQKKLHNGIEATDYEYRMTGQQTAAYSPSFSYKLGFDRPADGTLASRPDGNLASMAWGAGTTLDKGYQYTYTKLGEMTASDYFQKSGTSWTGQGDKYAEKGIEYDLNGNITRMKRYNSSGTSLHDLQYQYNNATNGNALSSVNGGTAFAYDAEGNMTADGMTGVKIAYNVLNLPEKVYKDGVSEEIRYIYSANGVKLATVCAGSSTYYRSVMIYARQGSGAEQLLYMLQPEGLVAREEGSSGEVFTYKYMKTDHVGSTRKLLAATKVGSTWTMQEEQSTDYYAFGCAWDAINNLHQNKYLYGGKEYQDGMLGNSMLGLYDFHARYYNPVLGRWFNIDPALQLANPYLYCGNNPMLYIDEDGEWFFVFIFGPAGFVVDMILWEATIEYVSQVIANYNDPNPDLTTYDKWVGKIDFFDVAISGLKGGATALFPAARPWLEYGTPLITNAVNMYGNGTNEYLGKGIKVGEWLGNTAINAGSTYMTGVLNKGTSKGFKSDDPSTWGIPQKAPDKKTLPIKDLLFNALDTGISKILQINVDRAREERRNSPLYPENPGNPFLPKMDNKNKEKIVRTKMDYNAIFNLQWKPQIQR